MSLDLRLITEDDDGFFEVNLTYNYSQMWAKAMGGVSHDPPASLITPRPAGSLKMVVVEDLTGCESIPIFDKAIAAMQADPLAYRALNPANGWGNADLFLERLKQCRKAARLYPDGVWEAYR